MEPPPTTESLPAARAQSWLSLASRLNSGTHVPAQRLAA